MARNSCYVCGKSISKNEFTKVFKHTICKNCIVQYKHSDGYYKEKLIDDVWNLYSKKPNFIALSNQVDDLHNNYGFTYKGMLYALHHWLKINEYNTAYMLYQLFPKAYYDAQEFYNKQKKIKASIKEVDTNVEVVQAKNVCDKPPLPLW